MSKTRTLPLAMALAALAAPAWASIANPISGTPIQITLGESFKVQLSNNDGCTFDYLATAIDETVVLLAPGQDMGVKGAGIIITGVGVGSTTVTIETMNGTCPPATHTYPVTVSADWKLLAKDFDKLAKAEFKDFKLSAKLGLNFYADTLKDLSVQYKDGELDDDGLHDGFHLAAVDLRQDWQIAAGLAYINVVGGGTQILADAEAVFGDVPPDFFAGGCDSFDWFQDSVCSRFADFHGAFDKASKKGIKKFEKVGGPRFGQWNILAPIYAGGALYPVQAMAITAPMPLTGPLTITTRPSGPKGDGRLLVSGMADSMLDGQLEVSLTWEEFGQPPTVETLTPPIVGNEWLAEFSDRAEGAYTLSVRYAGDAGRVDLPIHILAKF